MGVLRLRVQFLFWVFNVLHVSSFVGGPEMFHKAAMDAIGISELDSLCEGH